MSVCAKEADHCECCRLDGPSGGQGERVDARRAFCGWAIKAYCEVTPSKAVKPTVLPSAVRVWAGALEPLFDAR